MIGAPSRVDMRMARAHDVLPSVPTIALGYVFSLVSLVLAVLTLRTYQLTCAVVGHWGMDGRLTIEREP